METVTTSGKPVKPYRINLLMDLSRLLRCKINPQSECLDPVVGDSLKGLASRKLLFFFSAIGNESGSYKHQFPGYKPYVSSQPVMIEYLPEKYGRDAFLHLMEARSKRISMIVNLLKANGVSVSASDQSWTAIGQWISANIEPNREPGKGSYLFRPVWYSLLLDLSILLGEQIISLKPGNRWHFWADTPEAFPNVESRSPWVVGPDNRKSGRSVCLPMDLVFSTASLALNNKINNNSADKLWGKHLFLMALRGEKPKSPLGL